MWTHYLAALVRAGAAVVDGVTASPAEPSPWAAAGNFALALWKALR